MDASYFGEVDWSRQSAKIDKNVFVTCAQVACLEKSDSSVLSATQECKRLRGVHRRSGVPSFCGFGRGRFFRSFLGVHARTVVFLHGILYIIGFTIFGRPKHLYVFTLPSLHSGFKKLLQGFSKLGIFD